MTKKLTKDKQSNYQVAMSFTPEQKVGVKNHVLQHFSKDMNIPGFRAGNVPLEMVEKKIEPHYLEMAIVEHLVNKGIQELLEENKELKFIGEPYGYDTKEEEGQTKVTFFLDVYPEVEVKGKNWEAVKMNEIKIEATQKEIDDSLLNIQKNYADYKDAEVINVDTTISKLGLEFVDKKREVLEKGTTYLGETEFTESDFWKKTFDGQKKAAVVTLKYDSKKLPAVLHAKKTQPEELKITIQDIKEVVLPDLNDEMIGKLFGKDAEVKTLQELKDYIKKEILKQKEEAALVGIVENYLTEVKKAGISVAIPKVMIDQEFSARMQNLEKRFGSKEKVTEYFQQLGEEKTKEFVDGVKNAAGESLEKFFILNKITELLGLQIDWNNEQEPFFVEKQLYAKLVGKLKTAEPEKKKAPAKKAAPKKEATKKESPKK